MNKTIQCLNAKHTALVNQLNTQWNEIINMIDSDEKDKYEITEKVEEYISTIRNISHLPMAVLKNINPP